jgi:hypothetical protein
MKSWVIQQNLISEEQSSKVAKSVIADGGTVYPVKVIPFCDDVEFTENPASLDVIVYGSTKLSKLANSKGWTGIFFNDNFNAISWNANRNDMLNSDAVIIPAGEVSNFFDKEHFLDETILFIRPNEDLKAFDGTVTDVKEIRRWMETTHVGNYSFTTDTLVSIAAPKMIDAEWRWFIIDGKVVDGSMYRHSGNRKLKHETDPKIISEAQQKADIWLPHQNCVMDLALVHDEVQVIEFNCFNSSGFYDHDIDKIVRAVNRSKAF